MSPWRSERLAQEASEILRKAKRKSLLMEISFKMFDVLFVINL